MSEGGMIFLLWAINKRADVVKTRHENKQPTLFPIKRDELREPKRKGMKFTHPCPGCQT